MSTDRRAELLVLEWENDHSAWIGGTHVSHKATNRENQPIGLAFIKALVDAEVHRTALQGDHAADPRRKES